MNRHSPLDEDTRSNPPRPEGALRYLDALHVELREVLKELGLPGKLD
jgi:hypothetical protein